MRVLLDECLPRKLKRQLSGHDVSTVPEMAWSGIKNGELLQLMATVFDAFITIDGNMRYQQNLATMQIGVVVLVAPDNTIETLQPLVPKILQVLDSIEPGQIATISV